MGGVGGCWAKVWAGAMNREADGAVVCCDCNHGLDTPFLGA